MPEGPTESVEMCQKVFEIEHLYQNRSMNLQILKILMFKSDFKKHTIFEHKKVKKGCHENKSHFFRSHLLSILGQVDLTILHSGVKCHSG